jgi:uncharacterized membrane protein (UPF0127 family)
MEKGYLYVADNIFPTLLAISEDEQSQGLMGQEWPPPVMSFIYSSPRVNRFWMKNTPSPLDIVFCCNGEVTQICRGEPFSTMAIGDYKHSDLVVEFPYGTVNSSQIKLGHQIGLVKPDPAQLKRIIAEKCGQIVKI